MVLVAALRVAVMSEVLVHVLYQLPFAVLVAHFRHLSLESGLVACHRSLYTGKLTATEYRRPRKGGIKLRMRGPNSSERFGGGPNLLRNLVRGDHFLGGTKFLKSEEIGPGGDQIPQI